MSPLTELHSHLTRWTRWYRFRQAVHWLWYGLAGGLTVALLVSLILIFRSQLLENAFFLLVAGSALAGMGIAVLAAAFWPFPSLKAARYFDQSFGLKERTSTALELNPAREPDTASDGEMPLPAFAPRQIGDQQLEDALLAARQINPRAFLPVRVRWQEIALCLALGAGLFVTWYRGDTFFQMAQNFQAVQQAIAEQTKELEQLVEEIKNNPALTDEQKEELTQPLEEAIRELQEAETMEQAVSILKETEQQLQELTNEQALAQAENLANAGEQLSQQPGSALEQFGENLANGDLIAAANDLANLDLENLTQAEEEQLAAQLEQTANAVENTNPELAEQLREAAEAIQNGNTEAAQQALQQAAQTLANTGQQVAQAQAAQQAANQAAQGQQQVIQAGQPQNQTAQNGQGQQGQGQQGQGQQGQNGQGQQGQGQNGQGQNGQGQGNGNGGQNSGSGSGAGQGSTQGGEPGGEAGNDPIGQGNNPGDGGVTGFEPIGSAPNIGDAGETVTLPGSGEPGENVTGQGNVNPGTPGSSTVPYTEVFPTYSDAAIEAIENGLVPPGYRDLIRDYFSSLEP